MTASRFLAVLAALLFASFLRADVVVGDTREEVIRRHGFPSNVSKRGNHEYLGYPKGGRIELVDGKVIDVKGPLPAVIAAPPPATPAAAPTPPPATPIENRNSKIENPPLPAPATPPSATPIENPKSKIGNSPPAEPPVYDAAAATAALSSHIDKMDTAWGASPPKEHSHSPLDSLPSFLLGLVIRFGLTIAALKLAFKYWEMDAFWKGIFAIAGIDLVLHAILELLGTVSGGFTTMAAVENGLPGLALIYTINRFCFNKRLQNAITTAAAVKTVVTGLYIFGALAMLNSAFG